MYNNLISEDYLMHHGVKGMKWGVRHDPERVGSGRMSSRKQYKIDKRAAYERMKKTGQKLTSEGRQDDMKAVTKMVNRYDSDLKKAKENYKVSKIENYKSKLVSKADKKAGTYSRDAKETKNAIDDIKKMGTKSAYWEKHAREEAIKSGQKEKSRLISKGSSEKDAEFWGKLYEGSKYHSMMSSWRNQNDIKSYVSELTASRSNSIRLAKQYTSNKNSLMNYKVSATTKKKDLRKAYRDNLHFYE